MGGKKYSWVERLLATLPIHRLPNSFDQEIFDGGYAKTDRLSSS